MIGSLLGGGLFSTVNSATTSTSTVNITPYHNSALQSNIHPSYWTQSAQGISSSISVNPPLSMGNISDKEHPIFELTMEQLRAGWILHFGTDWVPATTLNAETDSYYKALAERMCLACELERYQFTNSQVGDLDYFYRIKT